jgi:hypothetical protein
MQAPEPRVCRSHRAIGVGTAHWFAPPLSPHQIGGSPASGSPVGGLQVFRGAPKSMTRRELFFERAGEGFNQNRVCAKTSKTAGFPQGLDSLNPAIPLFIEAPLHHAASEHTEAQGSFRPVAGGLNTFLEHKAPEVAHLGIQMSGKPGRFIFSTLVLVMQTTHSSIPLSSPTSPVNRCPYPTSKPAEIPPLLVRPQVPLPLGSTPSVRLNDLAAR